MATAFADGESAKARIAAVRKTLATSVRAAAKASKDFEVGFRRDLEKVRKSFESRFACVANAHEKAVVDSLGGLDDPMNIEDGPLAS